MTIDTSCEVRAMLLHRRYDHDLSLQQSKKRVPYPVREEWIIGRYNPIHLLYKSMNPKRLVGVFFVMAPLRPPGFLLWAESRLHQSRRVTASTIAISPPRPMEMETWATSRASSLLIAPGPQVVLISAIRSTDKQRPWSFSPQMDPTIVSEPATERRAERTLKR